MQNWYRFLKQLKTNSLNETKFVLAMPVKVMRLQEPIDLHAYSIYTTGFLNGWKSEIKTGKKAGMKLCVKQASRKPGMERGWNTTTFRCCIRGLTI